MQEKWAGYTVVEVMIVLGITSMIFLSAVVLFQGQQGKTQFSDAMRDIQSKIQDWGNDVSSGYYPTTTSGYSCTVSTVSPKKAVVTSSPSAQGTNEDCIYVGKVIQFRPDSSQVSAYTIFGNRLDPSGTGAIATSISAAQPVIAYNSSTGTDLTENYDMLFQAQTSSIPSSSCTTTSTCPTYTIALYHAIGTIPTGGNSANLFYMYNLGGNKDFTSISKVNDCVQALGSSGCSYPTTILAKAQFCFQNTVAHQYAVLTINPSGDSLNTDLKYVDSC